MDKNILRQYIDLKAETREIENRIRKLKDKLDRINAEGNVKYTVGGGAGGIQRYHIEGFPVAEYEETSYLLAKNIRLLEERKTKAHEMIISVEQFINTIDDSRMRRMITYRYIDGLSLLQTAQKMGKNYTEESCKKQLQRFMKKK